MSKYLLLIVLLFSLITVSHVDASSRSYIDTMVSLVHDLSQYAKSGHPRFQIMGNGGASLFLPVDGNTEENVAILMDSLDGELVESMFYGWAMENGNSTPDEERAYFCHALASPKAAKIPIFSLDYVKNDGEAQDAARRAGELGYIEGVSYRRELDVIPDDPPRENPNDVTSLKMAKNFLVLLNPGSFDNREKYLAALQSSPYDLLIIDLYFGEQMLNERELESLKRKPHGGRRLVLAYMSVGEAETYRPYWSDEWNESLPFWIDARNEEWEGNYKVKYWNDEWHDILYGNEDAYLDKIIAAGFDGAFLDVIDAYWYFMDKK